MAAAMSPRLVVLAAFLLLAVALGGCARSPFPQSLDGTPRSPPEGDADPAGTAAPTPAADLDVPDTNATPDAPASGNSTTPPAPMNGTVPPTGNSTEPGDSPEDSEGNLTESDGAAPETAGPRLAVGDEWTYNQSIVYPPYIAIFRNDRLWVDRTETVVLGGVAHDAVVLKTEQYTNKGPNRTAYQNITEWRRVSDLALLKRDVEKFETYPAPLYPSRSREMTEYDEPCDQFRWPLQEGLAWTVSCPGSLTRPDAPEAPPRRVWLNESSTVGTPQSVTVPAGSFQAFPLQVTTQVGTTSSSTTYYFATEACWWVRSSQYQDPEYDVKMLAFSCVPSG